MITSVEYIHYNFSQIFGRKSEAVLGIICVAQKKTEKTE